MASDNRGRLQSGLALALWLYVAVTSAIFVPYYNWQYAQQHGFSSWLFLGELVASAKAVAWPYFVFTSSSVPPEAANSFRDWTPEEKANSKHFLLSIQADLQSIQLSRERGNTELSASERHEILLLKETALREARLVTPIVLRKIHPELPRHLASEYLPGLEFRIRHLTSPGGDSGAERNGLALHEAWADWFNASKDAILIPK